MSNPDGPMQQHHFLMRRLHSLTGILPIGVFLIMHLTTNASILWGGFNSRAMGDSWMERGVSTYQHEVTFINNMPLLLLIEITLWVSIGFHSILGVYYAMGGKANNGSYKYGGNTRYMLQRLTGYVGIFFIFYHIATLRWGWTWLPGAEHWSHSNAASTLAHALQGSTEGFGGWGLAVSLFYFIGVSMLVFHFANGLWTAAITWGFTISRKAQQRWGYACAGLGAGLMVLAWASIVGFVIVDYDEAKAIEDAMHSGTHPVEIHDEMHDETHAETAAIEHTNTDG